MLARSNLLLIPEAWQNRNTKKNEWNTLYSLFGFSLDVYFCKCLFFFYICFQLCLIISSIFSYLSAWTVLIPLHEPEKQLR